MRGRRGPGKSPPLCHKRVRLESAIRLTVTPKGRYIALGKAVHILIFLASDKPSCLHVDTDMNLHILTCRRLSIDHVTRVDCSLCSMRCCHSNARQYCKGGRECCKVDRECYYKAWTEKDSNRMLQYLPVMHTGNRRSCNTGTRR